MKSFLSYMEVPVEYQLKNWKNSKLKDNMFLTAQALYKTKEFEFEKIIEIIKSDYRQYSAFEFKNGVKKSENWNNDRQNLIILDVDDGLSISQAKETFREFKYLIATTKSHQIQKKGLKCDRFRIIFPSSDIPRGEEYFDFMRMMERKYPFIDKQVNTKTGAFLGSANCIYFYNNGSEFSCSSIIEAFRRLEKSRMIDPQVQKPKQSVPQMRQNSNTDLNIEELKRRLSREIVANIVSSCGFKLNGKFMFKYRPNEKTASASISPELQIKDFGSDLSTDVIGFVMKEKQMHFVDAVNYVESFVGFRMEVA